MSPAPPIARTTRTHAVSLAASVGIALATTWVMLAHGWVSFDDGLIGLSAEQVLHGALPHADFAYPYTGGLPWLHALAMRAFGVHLLAPRYALFAAFALWLPVVWWLAARRVGAAGAAVLTVLAAWWSLTVYPAAMPTWYVLFAATWLAAALERWRTTRDARWLLAAGILGGLAIVAKQTGLYLVAAAMLGVLFDDQSRRREGGGAGRTDAGVLFAIALLGALVLRLLASRLASSGDLLVLLLPVAAVLVAAALRERGLTVDRAERWRALFSRMGVLLLGVAVPVALFILAYAVRSRAGSLFAGIVEGGLARIRALRQPMPGAWELLRHAAPMFVAIAVELRYGARRGARAVAIVAALVAAWFSSRGFFVYLSVWDAVTLASTVAVVAAVAIAARGAARGGGDDASLLALAAMTAFQGLHQFPYAAPNYVAYVAPLAFLLAAQTAAAAGVHRRLWFVAGTLLLFGGVFNRIGAVQTVGFGPVWWDDAHRLPSPRGRLLVTTVDSAAYTRLVELVREHRSAGRIYAGPELPQVYFLTGSPPLNRDAFEFVPHDLTDTNRLGGYVDTMRASMIVLKRKPMFLPPLSDDVHAWLARRYPHAEMVDSLFEVRWR
ncbi:MAG: glycosyltransferase family 39 protein [Proteobacteria bacterium]|nr:glycosyltransferase family 39 protein [Pseudomonadota bacterium]